MRGVLLTILVMTLTGVAGASEKCEVQAGVPFAGEFERPMANYNRASDRLATAGELTTADIAQLWDMGFDVVVDVRPAAPEVIAEERELVVAQGLAYYHWPYTDEGVAEADLAAFNALMADPRALRILIHCKRGSRAGGFLATHYLSVGADRGFALIAGRAAGLNLSMEEDLVARLDNS
jgi:uncharacterized protein (TIGR01244 family)